MIGMNLTSLVQPLVQVDGNLSTCEIFFSYV